MATLIGFAVAAPIVLAQTEPASPSDVPSAPLPPPPDIGPAVEAPPPIAKPRPRSAPRAPVAETPPPPAVLRSPVAVLQVLDKVTAETLRFEAPVGRRVRYKTLVVEVKACETRGYDSPQPRASAYLVVDSRLNGDRVEREAATNQVFHGWLFAFTPALNALQHPAYDLWLVACSASRPTT